MKVNKRKRRHKRLKKRQTRAGDPGLISDNVENHMPTSRADASTENTENFQENTTPVLELHNPRIVEGALVRASLMENELARSPVEAQTRNELQQSTIAFGIKSAVAELAGIRTELHNACNERDDLQKQLATTTFENDQLVKRLENSHAELKAACEERDKLKQQLAIATFNWGKAETRFENASETLDSVFDPMIETDLVNHPQLEPNFSTFLGWKPASWNLACTWGECVHSIW